MHVDLQKKHTFASLCSPDNLCFLQTDTLWQPFIQQVDWRHFSNSICSLHVSVSHFGNSHKIKNFHYYWVCYDNMASLVTQLGKNLPALQDTQVRSLNSWVKKIPWRRKWQPTPVLYPREFHGQRNRAG